MKRTKRALIVIGLTCLCIQVSRAQVAVAAGSGSISGRVVVQGKPIPKVRLGLQRGVTGLTLASNTLRSESDAEGRYKFSGLPAGSYSIIPLSSVYAWGDSPVGGAASTITIGDGEQATDVDVILKRGGVVTGKVTDAEGNPVVARFVQIDRVDGPLGSIPLGIQTSIDFTTDDRGVYRYYGVPPGKYRVSCGDGDGSFRTSGAGKSYPRTFHPNAPTAALATIVEVTEGGEATGVDIRLSPAVETYSIAGRTVDADTLEPVGGLSISLFMPAGGGRSQQYGGRSTSTSSGDFVLTSIPPGRWSISAESAYLPQGAVGTGYSDPIIVEVRDENVTGVEIRVRRGGSISGVAVLEGNANATNAPRMSDQRVMAFVQPVGANPVVPSPVRPSPIGADGTFRIEGLRPGRARILTTSVPGGIPTSLIRTERNGQTVSEGFEIGAGESVTGVRLVLAVASSSIVGQVMVTGGDLPPGATLMVTARFIGGAATGSARADTRGNFVIERLPAGEYELEVRPFAQQVVHGTAGKQMVSVADGETAKVTLTFALKAP